MQQNWKFNVKMIKEFMTEMSHKSDNNWSGYHYIDYHFYNTIGIQQEKFEYLWEDSNSPTQIDSCTNSM